MYIGQIAKQAALTPKTLRHYEQLGLLGKVARLGRYRVYSAQTLQQLQLIRHAQTLGFSLKELQKLRLGDANQTDWPQLQRMIEQKQLAIAQQLAHLHSCSAQLQLISDEINSCTEQAKCATKPLTLP